MTAIGQLEKADARPSDRPPSAVLRVGGGQLVGPSVEFDPHAGHQPTFTQGLQPLVSNATSDLLIVMTCWPVELLLAMM